LRIYAQTLCPKVSENATNGSWFCYLSPISDIPHKFGVATCLPLLGRKLPFLVAMNESPVFDSARCSSGNCGRRKSALENLLVLLETAEHDRFVFHLYQSPEGIPATHSKIAGKSGKQIERHLDVPDRAGYRIPGRASAVGTPVADRRLITASLTRTLRSNNSVDTAWAARSLVDLDGIGRPLGNR
jgi:hypothetical protein